jgi:hypothetical protein
MCHTISPLIDLVWTPLKDAPMDMRNTTNNSLHNLIWTPLKAAKLHLPLRVMSNTESSHCGSVGTPLRGVLSQQATNCRLNHHSSTISEGRFGIFSIYSRRNLFRHCSQNCPDFRLLGAPSLRASVSSIVRCPRPG